MTTACIDNLQFKKAVTINSTLVLKGKMTYVGRSSMEGAGDTFVEKVGRYPELVNTCYMVLVALDEDQKPVPVPQLICETPQEKKNLKTAPAASSFGKPGGMKGIDSLIYHEI